jgi:serine/threonine protein kinase
MYVCMYVCMCLDRNTSLLAKPRSHTYVSTQIYTYAHTKQVRHIGKHIGEALEYMHANGVIHGDVKPLNIVRRGERWKLIDLDAACELGSGAKAAAKFSSAYLPPEMVTKRDGGALWVLSELSEGVHESELREATVALDGKTFLCVCLYVCVF